MLCVEGVIFGASWCVLTFFFFFFFFSHLPVL